MSEGKDLLKNIYHSYTVKETFNKLSTEEGGISDEEAENRLSKFGYNQIEGKDKVNPFLIFFKQFASVLIYILIIAALIAWFYGKMIDVYVILGVVLLNAIMGFVQEYKAEKAIEALKNIILPTAKVYRDGVLEKIEAKKIVPGDVIFLEEGDRIPADARIFEARNFRTVEASLTGESSPTGKETKELDVNISVGDRKNMVWMGTFVAGGQAKAVVVATGNNTIFGGIAKDISKIEKKKSHFEVKIDKLAKQMGAIAIIGATLIFLVGFFIKEIEFEEILFFTIASLVSGIPEGLPAILVIVLAVGVSKMAKRNAIIRRLPAAETLGVTTVISTDKTGTLTQNTMNVRTIIFGDEKDVDVSGNGWEPKGDFHQDGRKISPLENPVIDKLLHISSICNNANLIKDESTSENDYKIIGDPTEASLVVLAEKAGLKKDVLGERKIDDLPFNSELKYRASLSVIAKEKDKQELYVVGAPEAVLERANFYLDRNGRKIKLDKNKKSEILKRVDGLTDNAMRTIALAYKPLPLKQKNLSDDIVDDMVFVGAVGIIDPPRPEARGAVLKAKRAGIRIIMTTGDHKGTAIAISKEVGIIDENESDNALTENELLEMSEEDFKKSIRKVNVFARLTPNMKLRIAQSLQEDGHIVAMTGDGVNDAPALKKSDIGISMGIIGTDVARESSEIILADDNFASIVSAIEEGRIVFKNVRQTSTNLISTNFAEHFTIISSLFLLHGQLPLLPTQILWLNLVTDGFSGAPLALEPGHTEIIKEKPRNKNEGILTLEVLPILIMTAILMAILTLLAFSYYYEESVEKARTAAFSMMAFTQLFRALNMRDMKRSVFKIGFFKNKYLIGAILAALVLQIAVIRISFFQNIFEFEPIEYSEIIIFIILSSSVFFFGEVYKYFRYKEERS